MNNELEIVSGETVNMKESIYNVFKRFIDIICAVIGCLLLVPISLLIKVSYLINKDFDSIFFTQFRTMVPNADEILYKTLEIDKVAAAEYSKNKKLKHDPRITKVGKILRKTSIDELPQLINILKGEMSLIGNRPYLPREIEDMGENYKTIISVKPGITGYWQVNGRSDTDFQTRVKMDVDYINTRSLWGDFKFLVKTFFIISRRKGAL